MLHAKVKSEGCWNYQMEKKMGQNVLKKNNCTKARLSLQFSHPNENCAVIKAFVYVSKYSNKGICC
jgi:hypothetical protein